jgi:hypothetical protein
MKSDGSPSGCFGASRLAGLGREEKFELPPDSSHSASQVTTAHLD